jgi:hypothetical protein
VASILCTWYFLCVACAAEVSFDKKGLLEAVHSVSIYGCAPIFLAQMFWKSRFKIDAVIMIICSIVIIINSVLTLQVSTAKPMIADLEE